MSISRTTGRRKWLLIMPAAILCLVGFFFGSRPEEAILKHVIEKKLALRQRKEALLKEPGIRVILAGTGVPVPAQHRESPCVAIIANNEFLVFDDGGNGARNLFSWGYPIHRITRVFLTHLHSDHMAGIGGLISATWIAGRTERIHVYAPDASRNLSHALYPPTSDEYRVGTETTGNAPDRRRIRELSQTDFPAAAKDFIPGIQYVIQGISMAYEPDVMERSANIQTRGPGQAELGYAIPHPLPDMDAANTPPDFGWGEMKTVYQSNNGKLVVKAFLVDHYACFPSYGYRIECEGRAVVISGDTEKSTYMQKCAKGADILIHEAVNMRMLEVVARVVENEYGDTQTAKHYRGASAHHTDTLDAARAAQDAGASRLVLTHLIPPIEPGFLAERLFAKGMRKIYKGEITVARDGMVIHLPPAASQSRPELSE